MLSKAATALSLLFSVLLLLSLPGESSEGGYSEGRPSETEVRLPATPKSNTTSGFSYGDWLAAGQPSANENWTSGTFVLRTATKDHYTAGLSSVWNNVAAGALDIRPLLREDLLLMANNKESQWSATWQSHRQAVLQRLIDTTGDTLLRNALEEAKSHSWVRRLEVDFRTKLRNRPGSFGIDAIVALQETTNTATGLQLRGFFGDEFTGANAGLFYRRATGDNLLGANIFLDYEDNDGAFWRWSLGGEWRNPYVELTGNRYIGITEGKRGIDGTTRYTADGTEIELALRAPYAPWLSGVLSYYDWDGEYGDAADTGLRYGIRVDRQLKGLSFEIEYEDPEEGEGAWGGRISYSHDFSQGLESASQPEDLSFDPRAHFFDSVRREYTQRIRQSGNAFTGRIVITHVNGRATLIGSELSLQIAGNGETFTTQLALISLEVISGVTTTVTGAIITATTTAPDDYTITATALVTAFTETPSTLRLSVNDWAIELHSELAFRTDSSTMTLINGELIIMRNNGISEVALTNGVTLNLTNNALISIATGQTTTTLQINSGLISLALNTGNTLDAIVREGTLIVSLAANAGIAANVGNTDGGAIILMSGTVTANITPLAGAIANASVVVTTGYTGLIGQVEATGGSNLRYTVISGGEFTVGATDRLLSLATAQSTPTTLTAMVQVSDSGTLGVQAVPVTASYTLLVGNELLFTPDKLGVTVTTYDNNLLLLTALVGGQLSAVSYALASTNPAGLGNFAIFTDSGIISLQQALTTPTTLSLYLTALENLGNISRTATLLFTVFATDPPAFAANLDNTTPVLITGNAGLVAQVNSSGGAGTHTYAFQSGGNNFAVGDDGRISLLIARPTPTTLIAILAANDGHPNTPQVLLSLTLRILDILNFSPNKLSIQLTTHGAVPVALHTATATDPLGGVITYALLSTNPAGFTDNINFTPANRVLNLTNQLTSPIAASVYIRATTDAATHKATLLVELGVVDPSAFVATLADAERRFTTGYTGLVAQVNSSGGGGTHTYAFDPADGNLTVGTDGSITLLTAIATPTTLTGTLAANDGHPNTPEVKLTLILTILAPVSFSPTAAVAMLTTHDSVPLTLDQANTQGGFGTKGYALVSTHPSAFGGNIAVSNNGNIILNQLITSPITASVYVRGSAAFGGNATLLLTVIAIDPTPFAAVLDDTSPIVITGNTGLVAQVNSSGGGGTHTYAIAPAGGNLTVGTDGRITLLTAVVTPATLLATLTANDGHPNTPAVVLNLTLRVLNILSFSPSKLSIQLATHGSVPVALHTAVAVDPLSGAITYALLSTNPAALVDSFSVKADGVLSLTAELTSLQEASVYIRATTDAATDKATLLIELGVVDPPAFAAVFADSSLQAIIGGSGLVAQVNTSGGSGTRTYAFDPADGNLTVGTDGGVVLLTAAAAATTLTGTLTANDGHPNTPEVKITLTLAAILDTPAFADAVNKFVITNTGAVASITNASPVADFTVIAGGDNFTVGVGVLSLKTAIPAAATLTASVVVPSLPLITLKHVLTVGACSFLTGCQPLVDYDGAGHGRYYGASSGGDADFISDRDSWLAINVTEARALIAAGADVNERINGDEPLLAAARFGSPALASVLLTAGADANAKSDLVFGGSSGTTPQNAGIFHYLYLAYTQDPTTGNLLASMFIAAGADVNYQDSTSSRRTPLDLFANFSPLSNDILIAAGGKCFENNVCSNVSGLIRLAAVSFSPAAVVATVNTTQTGDIYTVQAASGLGTRFVYEIQSVNPVGVSSNFSLISLDVNRAKLSLSAAQSDSYTIVIVATDQPAGAKATLHYARSSDDLVFVPSRVATSVTTHHSVPIALHTAVAVNLGSEAITYALLSTFPTAFTGNINFTPASGVLNITNALDTVIEASLYIRATTATENATLLIELGVVDPPTFAAVLDNSAPLILTGYAGLIAQVNSSGGGGTHSYAFGLPNGNLTVGTDGRISLQTLIATPTTLTGTLTANDTHPDTPEVKLTLTLAVSNPSLVDGVNKFVITNTGAVASVANIPPGGAAVLVAGGDSFELAGGLLNLTAEVAAATTLTARIVVSNSGNTPAVTLAHTLAIGACSFFTGCQPLVAHEGAAYGRHYDSSSDVGFSSDRDSWLAIDVPLAEALIAAGADVNERIAGDEPLLAVARFGAVALAEVLLTAGADANAKSDLVKGLTGTTTRNAGIFHHLENAPDANLLASLFVAAGAEVNYQDSSTQTPLDIFAGFSDPSIRNALIAGGGKCNTRCSSFPSFIRLAAVSFDPAEVTEAGTMINSGNIYTVQAASGMGTRFSYRLVSTFPASVASRFSAVSIDVNRAALSITSLENLGALTLSVYLEVADNTDPVTKATLRYALNVKEQLRFEPAVIELTEVLDSHFGFAIHNLDLAANEAKGADGNITYSLVTVRSQFTNNISVSKNTADDTFFWNPPPLIEQTVSIYIKAVDDSNSNTLIIIHDIQYPPQFVATFSVSATPFSAYTGPVAAVITSGGGGNGAGHVTTTYSVVFSGDKFTVGQGDGIVSLVVAQNALTTLTVSVVIDDQYSHVDVSPTLTIGYTVLAGGAELGLVDVVNKFVITNTGAVASVANIPPGGNVALVGGGDSFELAGGLLNLTAEVAAATTLTARIVVSNSGNTPVVTLAHTLAIGACSFLTGCQPLVDYDGAGHGRYYFDTSSSGFSSDRDSWQAIDVPLAQALIAAGADVNERIAGDEPLLAVARFGTPAVASVLLTAGADADAKSDLVFGLSGTTPRNAGIFHYLDSALNAADANSLASMFIAAGADVNYQDSFTGNETPLDVFATNSFLSNDILIAAGGKCFAFCPAGIIRLAAVSFDPAVVTEAGTFINSGNIYTVQAASGMGTRFSYRLVSTFPASVASRFSAVSIDVNRAALSLTSLENFGALTLSVYLEVADNTDPVTKATLRYALNVKEQLRFEPAVIELTEVLDSHFGFAIHNLDLAANEAKGADGNITYSLVTVRSQFTNNISVSKNTADDTFFWNPPPLIEQTVSIYIKAEDDSNSNTLIIIHDIQYPPQFVATFSVSATPFSAYTGPVAAVITSGGGGNGAGHVTTTYSVVFSGDKFTVGQGDGIVSLVVAQNALTTLTVSVVVDDQYSHVDVSPTLTVGYTVLAGGAEPGLVDAISKFVITNTGAVASITNVPPGGNVALVGGGDSFELAGGLLNLTAEIAAATTLTARVVVRNSGNTPVVTLAHTLNIGACSFLTGCQPLVDYAGARHGIRVLDNNKNWQGITAPTAQALLAAGADVNERIAGDEPLFAATRHYGTPALIAVLLTAGADATAIGELTDSSGVYQEGVFHYLSFIDSNSNSDEEDNNIGQLISIFITAGADVNLQLVANGAKRETPVDIWGNIDFRFGGIIIAAGGKCFRQCNAIVPVVNRFSLAAVSFDPAEVTEAGTMINSGNIYTVQAASGMGTRFSYRLVSTFPASVASRFSAVSIDVNRAALSLTSLENLGALTLSVYLEVADNTDPVTKATLRYALNVKEQLRFEPAVIELTEVLDSHFGFAIHNLDLAANEAKGADGNITYSLVSIHSSLTNNISVSKNTADDTFFWNPPPLIEQTVSIYIKAEDDSNSNTLIIIHDIQYPPQFVATFSVSATPFSAYTGPVAAVITSGGGGNGAGHVTTTYSVVFSGDKFTVGQGDGIVSLVVAQNALTTLTVSVVVDDQYSHVDVSPTLTVGYTVLAGGAEPGLVDAISKFVITNTGAVASITNVPPGGNVALVGGGDSFELAGGLLNLTAEVAAATTLTARIVVRNSGNTPVVTLAHILNIGACSFLTGCQPLVDYDGGSGGSQNGFNIQNADYNWLSDVTLAQGLVSAGADVDEVLNVFLSGINRYITPVIGFVAAAGVPAVASLLLDNGAEVNVAGYREGPSVGEDNNLGVFHYIAIGVGVSEASNQPVMLSLFATRGANVNQIASRIPDSMYTPLGNFNDRDILLGLATVIRTFGGKCLNNCRTGDIALATVSFNPGTVTVTVGDTDTGDIYTVQAASGLGTQFSYAVDSVSPAGSAANFNLVSVDVNSAKLNVGTALGGSRPSALTVFIEVTDNNSTSDKATLRVNIAE